MYNVGTEKLGMVTRPVGTGWGWGQCCGNGVGMGDERLTPCSFLVPKLTDFWRWRIGSLGQCNAIGCFEFFPDWIEKLI